MLYNAVCASKMFLVQLWFIVDDTVKLTFFHFSKKYNILDQICRHSCLKKVWVKNLVSAKKKSIFTASLVNNCNYLAAGSVFAQLHHL